MAMEDSIPSLERLFIPPTKPFEDDASTNVGDESDEELDVERADRELRLVFEDKMQTNAKTRSHGHSKVAALLIDWKKNSEGYLDTNSEVNRLRNVLQKKYHFAVRRKRLDTDLPQAVHTQMEKFLVDFKFEFPSDDTLLIIYYAGHGLNDVASPGTLRLHGTTTKPYSHKKHLNSIVWNQAEERIKDTKADILLIFDCCYAGELARDAKRGPVLGRIFEYLGATQWNERAMGPGDYSFTSALIWALNDLATCTSGFTVQELQHKIQEFTNFQNFPDPSHHQVACVGNRGPQSALRRLKLCPLVKGADIDQDDQDVSVQSRAGQPTFYLALELLFSKCPTEEDIADLCRLLQEIIGHDEYPLQHVLWRGLSPQEKWKVKWKDATHQVILRLRKTSLQSAEPQRLRTTKVSAPAIKIESPAGETRTLKCGSASNITVYSGEAPPPGAIQLAFVRGPQIGAKQNCFYATVLIQEKSWLLFSFSVCFVSTLWFMLSEHHPHLLPLWSERINNIPNYLTR